MTKISDKTNMKISEFVYGQGLNDRCTAETCGDTKKARLRRKTSTKCNNFASYIVDGNPRCVTHAKRDAFDFILKRQEINHVERN